MYLNSCIFNFVGCHTISIFLLFIYYRALCTDQIYSIFVWKQNLYTVKLLTLSIISLLTLFFPPLVQQTITQQFPLNDHILYVSPELAGDFEIVRWNRQEVKVVTTLSCNLNIPDGLDYLDKYGSFDLLAHIGHQNNLILESKKINTLVFIKGQQLLPVQKFKIYLPKHLKII